MQQSLKWYDSHTERPPNPISYYQLSFYYTIDNFVPNFKHNLL